MKNLVIFILLLVCAAGVPAQGVFNNETNTALEKVIQDYPNQFRNIKGHLLVSSPHEAEYQSVVNVPGADSSTITQFTESGRHIMSWQTVLYGSSDFEQAESKFKALYDEIKNTIIRLDGERPVILNGKYISPDEDRKQTIISFDILPSTGPTRQLRVDLVLRQQPDRRWLVELNVYDKDCRQGEGILATKGR